MIILKVSSYINVSISLKVIYIFERFNNFFFFQIHLIHFQEGSDSDSEDIFEDSVESTAALEATTARCTDTCTRSVHSNNEIKVKDIKICIYMTNT